MFATASGCCTISEYFCGPDDTRWTSVSFETHESALATLTEALRRDDEEVLYRCLGEDLKARFGVGGSVEWAIAWGKIRQEVPGIHVMGNGEVSEPIEIRPDRIRYVISRAGYHIAVELERVAFWEVSWAGQFGDDESGSFVEQLDRPLLAVTQSEPGGPQRVTIELEINPLEDGIRADRIRRAGVGHEWKVQDLTTIEAP